jgi:hypothetical protein
MKVSTNSTAGSNLILQAFRTGHFFSELHSLVDFTDCSKKGVASPPMKAVRARIGNNDFILAQ